MDVYLIRHGETVYNKLKKYQGQQEIPLSPEGREALRPAGFVPDQVYVSPLGRARETAEILFPGVKQIPVPGIMEMCFGKFEGQSYEDMEVTGLDGFYPDVFPVYGDYGIRIPENPSGVCNEIYEKTGVRAMIVDANDFTRDILGKGDNVTLTDEQLCEIIRDNPAGQDDQCTPFILIRKKQ